MDMFTNGTFLTGCETIIAASLNSYPGVTHIDTHLARLEQDEAPSEGRPLFRGETIPACIIKSIHVDS